MKYSYFKIFYYSRSTHPNPWQPDATVAQHRTPAAGCIITWHACTLYSSVHRSCLGARCLVHASARRHVLPWLRGSCLLLRCGGSAPQVLAQPLNWRWVRCGAISNVHVHVLGKRKFYFQKDQAAKVSSRSLSHVLFWASSLIFFPLA